MITYYLADVEDKMKDFFEFIDKADKISPTVIVINSGGGVCMDFEVIYHRLKLLIRLGYFIELQVCYAASSAFRLCYKLKNNVVLIEGADGMAHMERIHIPSHGHTVIGDDPINVGRKAYYDATQQKPFDFFTPKEKKLFLSGKDVYFNPDRMKQIFPD